MPQINRVRIINFSYNNDKRHIMDEKFNFYRGENALLSLKNGGGKSVLVQLMLQPIIPLIKIQGRSIKDFFKRKKTPAYVLIEWKLEDMGGYLLTGICIANREAQTRENQDTENSIKYFTFTAQYSESNLYDIENIPLCKRETNCLFVLPFKEASVLIQEKSRDNKFDIEYYSQDDGVRYNTDLMSFNLSSDEWKNIIARINSDEGGVIEIFEKCKTAQQLMHEWMIKTIEKVIYKDREDYRKLEMMLENLVEEMIGNEQYIHEKSVLEQFLNRIGEFSEELEVLIKGFDKQNKTEVEMVLMHSYLAVQTIKLIEMIEQNNAAIEEQNRVLKHINLEERSLEYYKWKDEFDRLYQEHEVIIEKLNITNGSLTETIRRRDTQKVAGIYTDVKELKAELVSIEEEILRVKGEGLEQDKIKSLEYSLKLGYEKRLSSFTEQIQKANNDIKTQEEKISEFKEKESNIVGHIEELRHQEGICEKSIEDFLRLEVKIKSTIGFVVNRNLFGEADAVELEKTYKVLKAKLLEYYNSKKVLEDNLTKHKDRQNKIKEETKALQTESKNLTIRIDEKDRALKEYQQIEEELKVIFQKYGLDFAKRFNFEEIQREFKSIVNDLRDSQFEYQRELTNTRKTIDALKKGILHVPEEFAVFLEANDINFNTGESYLGKQTPEIRERLLESIPLLPYSFILTDDDIEKLKYIYPEHPVYQLIPVISYGSLNEIFDASGKMIGIGKGTALLCLYDQRMINTDSIEAYSNELENESQELAVKLKHYTELLEVAQKDIAAVSKYKSDKGYRHNIEIQLDGLIRKQEELERSMKALEKEQTGLDESMGNIYQNINKTDKRIDGAKREISDYEDYLESNKKYEENIKQQAKFKEELESLRQNIAEIKRLTKESTSIKYGLETDKSKMEREKDEADKKYNRYRNAEEAEILEQDMESMEARLEALMKEVTGTLDRLEKDREGKNKDIKRKNKEIEGFGLPPSEYEGVRFDETLLKKLNAEYRELEEFKKEQDGVERKIDNEKSTAEALMNNSINEVRKIADSPVPKNEILMNFEGRRKDSRKIIDDKQKESKELDNKNRQYTNIINEIEKTIDICKINNYKIDICRIDNCNNDNFGTDNCRTDNCRNDNCRNDNLRTDNYKIDNCRIDNYKIDNFNNKLAQKYCIRIGVKEDFDILAEELRRLRRENGTHEREISSKYFRMANEYREKNPNIANIFKGLDPLKEQAEKDSEKYYYLYERTANQKDVLGDMIRIYENQLANLERNKNDMVTQSFHHAMQLYEEVQKITRDSSIKLMGKSRPVSMLRINMVEPEEGSRSTEKMRIYIESCVALVRDDMKKDKKKEEIRKNINKYMSSWELLNVISDLSKLVIEAYKIDINIINSQYKTWEQVMKENSGGERFVSFFAVLAALMSYARTSGRTEDDYVRNKDTKVLIMDNPFGPISSEHLLKPMFEIAKKYNTQLICLTDLKQNSILNCFNLIYMLKIRTSTFGTNEYLKVEEQVREGIDLERDENLEKAVFKAGEYVQMRLD